MRLIGITGSIACGKTTVSNELLRLGYPVIDGDRLSHELTGPGGAAVRDVISVFVVIVHLAHSNLVFPSTVDAKESPGHLTAAVFAIVI